MGHAQSHFTHHLIETPESLTYVYTRSNGLGAVESRHTMATPRLGTPGIQSMLTFSDGHGYVTTQHLRGCMANNFDLYRLEGGPQDGFNRGDYSHLLAPRVCTCGHGCA